MPPQEDITNADGITPQLLSFDIHDPSSKDQITFSHADVNIDDFVRLEWSIDEVLAHFFGSAEEGKTLGDRDSTFVILAYADKMMGLFPKKVSEFIDDLITRKNEKEIGDFYAYLEMVAISETDIPLSDYLKILFGEEKFAQNITTLNEIPGCCKKDVIFRVVSTTFKEKFFNTATLPGELGVYRSIVMSMKNSKLSTLFVENLQLLWKRCLAKEGEEAVDIEAETDETHMEHVLFYNSVTKLIAELDEEKRKQGISFEFIRKDIRSMFIPLGFKTFDEDGHRVLEVFGRKVVLSAVMPKLQQKLDSKITQLRFSGANEVIVDADINHSGISISIVSPTVTIKGQITFDISGEDAPDNSTIEKAVNGKEKGEDGENGHDGIAGGSAGHFCIHADTVVNPEKLHVIMNGGNGNNGQDGGDGAVGADGYGEKFNEVFSADEIASMKWKSAGNALTGGIGYNLVGAFERTMMSTGTIRVTNQSSYYLSTHIICYYEGTKGQPGGQGGQNGCGGEGGKKGDASIINAKGGDPFPIRVTAQNGLDGKSGKPGNTGQHGKEGWDVGITRRSIEAPNEYGGNHNQKFEINFDKNYTPDRVYIKAMYNGSGSLCYATIKPRQRQIQQMLLL